MTYGMGPHLMLDCYKCFREKLIDMSLLFEILNTFPEKIGLNKVMAPYVFKYEGQKPEDWGISGVVLSQESHVTIHTFPEKDHAFIDIFSANDFDLDFAVSYLTNAFSAKEHDAKIANRAIDLPTKITLSRIEEPALAS